MFCRRLVRSSPSRQTFAVSIFDGVFRTSGVTTRRHAWIARQDEGPSTISLSPNLYTGIPFGKKREKNKAGTWVSGRWQFARIVYFRLSRRNAGHSGRARDQRREQAFFPGGAEARDFPEEVLKGDLRDSARANCCSCWSEYCEWRAEIVYADHDSEFQKTKRRVNFVAAYRHRQARESIRISLDTFYDYIMCAIRNVLKFCYHCYDTRLSRLCYESWKIYTAESIATYSYLSTNSLFSRFFNSIFNPIIL